MFCYSFPSADCCIYYTDYRLHLLHQAAGTAGLCSSSFCLGATQKEQRRNSKATSEPSVFVSHPCERTQVTLFSSFICMLGANPAMDLKTNHSY